MMYTMRHSSIKQTFSCKNRFFIPRIENFSISENSFFIPGERRFLTKISADFYPGNSGFFIRRIWNFWEWGFIRMGIFFIRWDIPRKSHLWSYTKYGLNILLIKFIDLLAYNTAIGCKSVFWKLNFVYTAPLLSKDYNFFFHINLIFPN